MPREGPGCPASSLAGSQWSASAAQTRPESTTNTLNTAIKTVNDFLSGFTVSTNVENAWKRVQEAAKKPAGHRCPDATEAVNKAINDGYTRIEALIKAKVPTKPPTYAEAASSQRGPGVQAQREAYVSARRQREIVVARGTETLEEKRRNGRELVEDLNKGEKRGILAARRLPSGDVLLTTESRETKERLEKDQSWLNAFGEGAKVKRRACVVLAHGIRVDQIDTKKQAEAIQALYGQNPGLQAKAEILGVAWPSKVFRYSKRISPLYI